MFRPVKSPHLTEEDFQFVCKRHSEIEALSNIALEAQNDDSQTRKSQANKDGENSTAPPPLRKPRVYHRIRPLNENETPPSAQFDQSRYKFDEVFFPSATNLEVYQSTLEPHLCLLENGGSVIFFAYGHTGTGKTHSTLGYGSEAGLYTLAARQLQRTLPPRCLLAIRCAEIHLDGVYDLVDGRRTECTLREDGRGNLHIRARPIKDDETGNVYATGQRATYCGPDEDILEPLTDAIASRTVGSSSLHDQSSRSHCVVQVEIVSEELVRARNELEEAEAALHPVGSAKDTASISTATLFCYENGALSLTCDHGSETGAEWMGRFEEITSDIIVKYNAFIPQAKIVSEKRRLVRDVLNSGPPCLTGTITLCDLAGSDHDKRDLKDTTAQERKESQMINGDLLALKQCFRGLANAKGNRRTRLPFRQSKLTRVLKPAFEAAGNGDGGGSGGGGAQAVMLCTTCPAAEMVAPTVSTLRYGQLFS